MNEKKRETQKECGTVSFVEFVGKAWNAMQIADACIKFMEKNI